MMVSPLVLSRCSLDVSPLSLSTNSFQKNVLNASCEENYPPVYHHRPSKQLDVDAIEEEPPSAEVMNPNSSAITLSWPTMLRIMLIVYGLLLVMH